MHPAMNSSIILPILKRTNQCVYSLASSRLKSKKQVEAVKQCHIDNVISVNQVH